MKCFSIFTSQPPNLPVYFNTIASNFYFLIQFLQELEEQVVPKVVNELV